MSAQNTSTATGTAKGTATVTGTATATPGKPLLNNIGLLALAATLLILLAVWGAFWQPVHPDAYRVPSWRDVFYPRESNAWLRLPALHSRINGSFTLGDGRHFWAVGDDGLILFSDDGGLNWQQGRVLDDSTPAPTRAGLWSIIGVAQAGMPAKSNSANITEVSPSTDSIVFKPVLNAVKQNDAPLENPPAIEAPRYLNIQQSAPVANTLDGKAEANAAAKAGLSDKQVVDKIAATPSLKTLAEPLANTPTLAPSSPPNPTQNQMDAKGFHTQMRAVFFVDSDRGWAVGNDGVIIATGDGGKSWQRQTSNTSALLTGVHFADDRHGWAVVNYGRIVVTADGGQTWQPQTNTTAEGLNGVHFADARHGWAVGRNGSIVATADGGTTWQPQTSNIKEWFVDVHFADDQHGWAVGGDGSIVATADGGTTWQRQTSNTKEWLLGVHFPDDRHGWAVGTGGTIVATADGGQTWQPQTSNTRENLLGVHFADAGHGWAVGQNGSIVATADGGTTWQPQPRNSREKLNGVQFSDDLHGLGVADDGSILATSDGGKTWQAIQYHKSPALWVYPLLLLACALALVLGIRRIQQSKRPPDQHSIMNRAMTDKPVGGGDGGGADLLGARLLAAGLVQFLSNHNTLPPLTLAITGDWGSGKSSVMNFLQAGLRRNGLKTLWFNAWHHREEQNVLASVFSSLHKQIIGPWWTWRGIWFRLQLLWCRGLLAKTLLSTMAFTLLFCLSWLVSHPQQRGEVGHYLQYQIGYIEPVMLSADGLEALCKAPTSGKALFESQQCQKLRTGNLLAPAKVTLKDCIADDTQKQAAHCFARPIELAEAVERLLNIHLSLEDEKTLLATAEHVHADFPLPIGAKWLSGLLALIGVLLAKAMPLVGVAPAKLLQGAVALANGAPAATEAVGTRGLCDRHFKRITQVLGRRRLVLFIDDLDRCDSEHTKRVLEVSNFLATAGDLYIVLGMAPRYVMANVTLCFERVAEAVKEVDAMNGDTVDQRPGSGQSWFARHFLQKLIQIEVPVPEPKPEQVLALLTGEVGDDGTDDEVRKLDQALQRQEQEEQKLDALLRAVSKVMTWLMLLGALLAGGIWGVQWQPEATQAMLSPRTETATATTAPNPAMAAQPTSTATPIAEPTPKPESNQPAFVPGQESDNGSAWLTLLLLLILSSLVSLALWLLREPTLLESTALSWLRPLLRRWKIAVLGPEGTEDSDAFATALQIWYPLIAMANPIPRNVKTFINQLRYYASRNNPTGASNGQEAQLVAMAATNYAFGEAMEQVFAVTQKDGNTWEFSNADFITALDAGKTSIALNAAVKHLEIFGEFPSAELCRKFKQYHDWISIQRRDPVTASTVKNQEAVRE